jgi:ribonuclease VapC
MTRYYVFDAWALLALLQSEEPAAARVRHLLHEAEQQQANIWMSIINLGEVYYRIGRARGKTVADATLDQVRKLPLEMISASDARVMAAATFKLDHRVSYADAFAGALANDEDRILVTGDPELLALTEVLRLEKLERGKR